MIRIAFFSEDHPSGRIADWPAVPRIGDTVSFKHENGLSRLKVTDVEWNADGDAALQTVAVHLTY